MKDCPFLTHRAMNLAMKTFFNAKSAASQILSLTALVLLAGCGGGKDDAAPMPGQPYPPNTQPGGPYQGPQGQNPYGNGASCAERFPDPQGTAIDLNTIVDGSRGWTRLVSVDQYEETTLNGYPVSGTAKTTIRYSESGNRFHDARPLMDVRSGQSCSTDRSMHSGSAFSVVKLPLAIRRRDGAIWQHMFLNLGSDQQRRSRRGRRASGLLWRVDGVHPSAASNIAAFYQDIYAQGFEATSAGRLPNGDIEIFFSDVGGSVYGGAASRKYVRAIYHPDAPGQFDNGFDYDTYEDSFEETYESDYEY
jgi:hypothetical protein